MPEQPMHSSPSVFVIMVSPCFHLSLALSGGTEIASGGRLTAIKDPKRVVNLVPMQLSKMLSIWRPAVLTQGGEEKGEAG